MNKRIIANELVPVYETDTGERIVDGRELHDYLLVDTRFNDWMDRRLQKYGFVENEDFYSFLSKTPDGGRPSVDYLLKLDVAKEISMVENNEQGSRARKYFIEVERRYKTQAIEVSRLSPELQMFKQMWDGLARSQIEQAETQRQLSENSAKVQQVETAVATIKETFLHRDKDWRDSINKMLVAAAKRSGGKYQEMRAESYQRLEERGHCNLNRRLRGLRERLVETGSTRSRIEEANRMDVIEADPRLREIYTTIVKELSIGSL